MSFQKDGKSVYCYSIAFGSGYDDFTNDYDFWSFIKYTDFRDQVWKIRKEWREQNPMPNFIPFLMEKLQLEYLEYVAAISLNLS